MPLPNVLSGRTAQCTARSKRSLGRCLNPAAFGMPVCRFHGARRPETIKRGSGHPQYRHGRETKERREIRRGASIRLRKLEDLMHELNLTSAKRTSGRKPGFRRQVKVPRYDRPESRRSRLERGLLGSSRGVYKRIDNS